MSEPFTIKERPKYAVTLDAKNATEPTYKLDVWIYNIYVGPKRTVRRQTDDYFSQPEYAVPPPETWTLDTIRMLFHQFAEFLPDSVPGPLDVLVRHCCVGAVQERFDFVIYGKVTEKHTMEVLFQVPAKSLTEPMRAVLTTLTPEPVPLPCVLSPDAIGGDEWAKRYGSDKVTRAEAARAKRVLGRLKSLCYLTPHAIALLEAFLEGADPNGDTKDDE